MATKAQLALIHVAKAKLKLTDEIYRDILWVQARVESAKDLDAAGVERVLTRFKELGFQTPGDGQPGGRVIQFRTNKRFGPPPSNNQTSGAELPTSNQLGLIQHLYEDLGWTELSRQRRFTMRQCQGSPWPTRQQASQLIETLKKMVARGYSEREERAAAASPSSRRRPDRSLKPGITNHQQ